MSGKKWLILLSVILLSSAGMIIAQENPAVKPENLVGTWELTVNAGEMIINLNLVLVLENGLLAGKISEAYGNFADVQVGDLKLENNKLSFNLTVASPPDGQIRPWTFELQVSGEELEGIVYNNDLQISVPVRGKKLSG
ncbi:MAG: hypothetical protein ACUVRL_10615 [Candidatus Saccharicenans sp.]|uniref:hypothetical protein n=1 Tax=Candidatus Saccharicenans sp. TaxID=2819258 RepID=UPI00404B3096